MKQEQFQTDQSKPLIQKKKEYEEAVLDYLGGTPTKASFASQAATASFCRTTRLLSECGSTASKSGFVSSERVHCATPETVPLAIGRREHGVVRHLSTPPGNSRNSQFTLNEYRCHTPALNRAPLRWDGNPTQMDECPTLHQLRQTFVHG